MVNDIHSHVLFGVDDGSVDINMSLQMIRSAQQQGVRNIICSSHSGYDTPTYNNNFNALRRAISQEGIGVNVYKGCEIFCTHYNVIKNIHKLNQKELETINNTKYVLIEFDPYEEIENMVTCVKAFILSDYVPVIAHAERYYSIHNNIDAARKIKALGGLIQVNAYSIDAEKSLSIKKCARELLKHELVAFIGSDAHRTNHRVYNIDKGIDYIYSHCNKTYTDNVCYNNAKNMFNLI